MRLPLILVIACAALFLHNVSSLDLYPPKAEMTAQDYIDRSNYMAKVALPWQEGGSSFAFNNLSQAGDFLFGLVYPLPLATQSIHSLTLYAILETNAVEPPVAERRRLAAGDNIWEPLDIMYWGTDGVGSAHIFVASIATIESKWIKTDFGTKWKFSTVSKWFFNSSENGNSILYVEVQCPISLTREKSVEGSYDEPQVTHLTSTSAGKVDIDLSISATLLPCIDNDPTDLSTCTRLGINEDPPVFKLNDFAKFELFLDNSDFAQVYYLQKNKIEMKTDSMEAAADFTSASIAGDITKGKMTFKLPMAIVGNPITVSAIATLSTTASRRRILASASSKATFAASDVGVKIDNAKTVSGIRSFMFSILLFFGIVLILL